MTGTGARKPSESAERDAARRRGLEGSQHSAVVPRSSMLATHADDMMTKSAFHALADNVRDYAIFLMNADGVITLWGEGAYHMKGWTKEQAEGAHLRFLYTDGGSEDGTAEDHLDSAARTGEYTGEGCRMRCDGTTFWAHVTITALRNAEGSLLGFAKVTRDLTARRSADAVLFAAGEAADAANLAKSGFLATMSHEIRTPLNAILGYNELLALEIAGPLSAEQRIFVQRSAASGRHLLTLIDDILDFSRLEANRIVVGRERCRIDAAVREAVAIVDRDAATREVVIVKEIDSTLSYWGDESRVRQIVVNLLSNAIKFTDAGGRIVLRATTTGAPAPDTQLRGDGPWLCLCVEDTGLGIRKDRLEAIFEPFVQADMTLTRQHGGTGLGLAISRKLARLMGGDLTVRSIDGEGSSFYLWLAEATTTRNEEAPG